ncbi:MAG: PcfJ domain-containing protein [Deltaproteobacteria bacterium]|nr:PcfJ domain-containing protein [Deltaproteobacteria bacterium]
MRAHLLLPDAGLSWPLQSDDDNRIGLPPWSRISPPGVRQRVAAQVRYRGGEWTAEPCGGYVRLSRRGRPLDLDAALVDGDVIEVNGVQLVLEIEDEGELAADAASPAAFLVLQNGYAHRLNRGDTTSIGDGPDFDVRVRLGRGGGSCLVAFADGAWTVAAAADTPVAVLQDGQRIEVHTRLALRHGAVLEIDDVAQVELIDLDERRQELPAAPPARAGAPLAGAVVPEDDTEELALAAPPQRPGATPRPPPAERRLVIEEVPQGLFLWTDAGSLGVDVSAHDLCLLGERGDVDRFGASRAGMDAALRKVTALLRPRPLSDGVVDRLRTALMAALRKNAGAHAAAAQAAEVCVADIEPTPLVLARLVVDDHFLLADAARFTACATAIAHIEDDAVTDADTPERAEIWAHQLRRWRDLYLAPGSTARSVNRALAEFGEDAHPRVLWGLRKVRLAAPMPSRAHMKLLCALGANAYTRGAALDQHLTELVLKASTVEVGEALVILDEGELDAIRTNVETPEEVLAGLVLTTDLDEVEQVFRRRPRFPDVFAVALQHLKTPLRTETMRPPIALPRVPGLAFLSSVGALMEEGRAMSHCAALYAQRAVAGESYLFHYQEGQQAATIEVAADGTVLQSRAPGNGKNVASSNGERILRRWGRALRLLRLGEPSASLWAGGGPTPPQSLEPVRTLAELVNAYRAYVTDTDDVFELIIEWCVTSARGALDGRTWIAKGRQGPDDHLVLLDDKGAIVGTSEAELQLTLGTGRDVDGAR